MSGRQVPRHCPKCREPELVEKMLSDDTTHIDVCPSCRGGWFDVKELAAVLSVAVDSLAPPTDAVKTSCICPNCGVPLSQILYPETSIEVDVCEECSGVWLDRGEFRGINKARAQYQDKLKFSDPMAKPASFKEAVIQFVDRILIRIHD